MNINPEQLSLTFQTLSDINWLQGKESWKNINTIGMVQRERQVGEDISI